MVLRFIIIGIMYLFNSSEIDSVDVPFNSLVPAHWPCSPPNASLSVTLFLVRTILGDDKATRYFFRKKYQVQLVSLWGVVISPSEKLREAET